MTEKETRGAVKYWEITAKRDYDTMLGLFKIKRYPESLFFGHIVLEKTLKGLVVQETGEQAPFTHDLIRLAKLTKISLNKNELDLLKTISAFNIRARYPEQKLKLYKICTEKYTKDKLEKITKLYKSLCQNQKQ
ncbi:MAG: HEPN domain protein [Parcubacteria group bacterium GW2011_GWB1_41_5]|nr:MAG: HEPN domain protein [Parcubacteria group bacterium GW2011_GWB1_41_5]